MFTESHLDLGVTVIRKAVEEDLKQNYHEAYNLYQKSLDYFRLALTYERDKASRTLIFEKIKECTARSEALQSWYLVDSSRVKGRSTTSLNKDRNAVHPTVKGNPGQAPSTNGSDKDKQIVSSGNVYKGQQVTGSSTTVGSRDTEIRGIKGTRHRDWALDIVKKAIDEDHKQNYHEAYKLYQTAIDYFRLALDQEMNANAGAILRRKTNEYIARAQMLKDYLDNLGQKQTIERDESADGGQSYAHPCVKEYLDRGVNTVKKAIEEDRQRNYGTAYKLYQDSLDNFRLALKYEKNDKSKEFIRSKISEYFARVEKLKGRTDK